MIDVSWFDFYSWFFGLFCGFCMGLILAILRDVYYHRRLMKND